jgi:branched-subunit amino acid transport protein AzlD
MKTSINEALILSVVMAAVIFFCRAFPFLFFREKAGDGTASSPSNRRIAFLAFVEKTVPPVAMTVLAFNSLASPARASPREIIPALAAAALTAIVHLWRRNPLISIFGGTAVYILLLRVLP